MSDNGADFTDVSRGEPAVPRLVPLELPRPATTQWAGRAASCTTALVLGRGVEHAAGADQGLAGEGGMRVPFILSLPPVAEGGLSPTVPIAPAFAWVTDVLPTLLDLRGIALPGGLAKRYRPSGQDLGCPTCAARPCCVHAADEALSASRAWAPRRCSRATGSCSAWAAPTTACWRLFNLQRRPEVKAATCRWPGPTWCSRCWPTWQAYDRANGVVMPEPWFMIPIRQLLRNNWPVLLKQLWPSCRRRCWSRWPRSSGC